jgi:exosortase/archaeosortase family protein
MSSVTYPEGRRLLREDLVRRLRPTVEFARRYRRWWPAFGLVLAGLFAYHFTLLSLFDFLRLDTPLAYLPLLPLFTAWTVYGRVQRYKSSAAPIQDRQVDYLVGIPVMALAMLLVTIGPAIWSTYYWSERPDVISMALFISGGVILFYGFNWFWRLRGPLLFLFLMWPSLYLHLLSGVMQLFTDVTNAALAKVVLKFPLGISPGGGPGLLSVSIRHAPPLLVSVGTACSGANSVIGFLVIGSALLVGAHGRRSLKLLWLLTGLLLAFALNIVRLVSILILAANGHPALALGGYHAVIGLALFGVAVVLMSAALPLYRLGRHREEFAPAGALPVPVTPSLTTWRRRLPLAAFLLLTLLLVFANHDLGAYASFADGTGAPTVQPFGSIKPAAAGNKVAKINMYKINTYLWARQYFGATSDFSRWAVVGPSSGAVLADIVRTEDKGALDAYGLQNCFIFHDYDISTSKRLDLGHGVTALVLNYSDPATKSQWATVSWAWPVKYQGQTNFERVALTSSLTGGAIAAPEQQAGDGLRSLVISIWNAFGDPRYNSVPQSNFASTDRRLQVLAERLVADTVRRGGS